MAIDGRVLPHDTEAEKSVLGSMLISAEAVAIAMEQLRPEDFYSASHQEIFEAMRTLFGESTAVDIVTLVNELNRRRRMDGVGGLAYVTELSTMVPSASNAKYYIEIVLEKSKLRRLIKVSSDTAGECYQEAKKLDEILNIAEKGIFDIALNNERSKLEAVAGILPRTMSRIEQQYLNRGQLSGVPTGFPSLDNMLSGLQKSNLIIVAARPSVGKTSFALNIAQHAALRAGKCVAVFSLEMGKEEVTNRILCSEARVDMEKVRHGTLTEKDWEKLAASMGELTRSNLYIDDTPGISVPEVRSKCRRLRIEHGALDLVIIDYLTLMGTEGYIKADSRQQEISELSRTLKGLARDLDVPVITISQLSRASEKRSDHRPILSDLRDSGAIEQDADVVLFLHRDSYYADSNAESENSAQVIVAKQRNGPVGDIDLYWESEYTRYSERTERY